MENLHTLSIRSGLGHQIDFFLVDTKNFISNRNRKEFILTDTSVQPSLVISQSTALNEYSQDTPSMDIYGISLNLPRSEGAIDFVRDFQRFDMIVVSSRYVKAIISCAQQQILPDYADRLFTIDQVVKNRDGNLLGCCGFRKAFWFQDPDFYIHAFAANQNPSLASARLCYEFFSCQIGAYPNLRDKIFYLGNLIRNEENRRATPRQQIFNV